MDSNLSDSTLDEVCFFTRSPSRVRILELLRQQDSDLSDVRSQLNISHSTAQRNLSDLVERQYVTKNVKTATYSISVPGEIVYHHLREICSFIDATLALCGFCRHFPKCIPISPERLTGMTITTATRSQPFQPLYRFSDLLETATTVRMLNPGRNPMYIDTFATRIENNKNETEVILSEDSATHFTEWCGSDLSELNDIQNTTILVTETLPDFGVAVLDTEAVLMSYNHDHKTHALMEIEEETAEMYEWALDEYMTQRNSFE